MNKSLIIIAIIAVLGIVGVTSYNGMLSSQLEVDNTWSKVESAYQRRADLIPNLVNTVKGYANFEKETLTQVIEARSKATSVNIDPTNITPESLQQFQQAQGQVSSALSRLLVTVEKYPELKANENFMALQSQLEGTENRIKVERDTFNDAVKNYNYTIQSFPRNIIASLFGFIKKEAFKAEAGSEKVPSVTF
ncbi:MAG: LemA family protein [Solirubrobacteraceae bacterium]